MDMRLNAPETASVFGTPNDKALAQRAASPTIDA